MNICYLGPLRDYSGYGEANRHIVAALDAAGVNVIASLVSYASENSEFGPLGETVTRLLANSGDYKIKFIHTTPDQYKRHMEEGKFHIGHFFWETDVVPHEYARGLELMDEIWTGSKANAAAIKKAGVKTPVFIFPQPIEIDREWGEPYIIPDFQAEDYLFYSIFEWTERKNPEALLTAYWRQFQENQKVGLLIKTYFRNFSLSSKQEIHRHIRKIKEKCASEYGITNFAPVFVYLDLMDRQHINRLHKTGDAFVSAHRGEGWGVPQVEAALAGNLVISTGYGGCHEYFSDSKNALILDYEMVPVAGMDHAENLYSSDQNWAEVDSADLMRSLQFAFDGRAKHIATEGHRLVREQFNFKKVGDAMMERLKVIEAAL